MTIESLFNERELLALVADGDQQAFAKIFDHYRPNIYTTVLRLIGDEQVAEEILLDVFLKVWLKQKELAFVNNFGGWLYTISENATLNAIRKIKIGKEKITLRNELPDSSYAHAEERLLNKEYEAVLHKAILRLPPKQQQAYILIRQEGKTREEAALILGVSPETVKSNLDQANKSVRAYCIASLEGFAFIYALVCLCEKI